MQVGMKIRSSFKSVIERQISEAFTISRAENKEVKLINPKAEYNCCTLPWLSTQSIEEQIEEIESKKNKEISKEVRELKNKKKARKKEKLEKDETLNEVCKEILREGEPEWKRKKSEVGREREKKK